MAGELKALRAESGANAADPVLKQAAPATTAESTTARCAQEREQAKWASVQAQAGRWQSQQRQDVQVEACWRELRGTWAGIDGSDRHRHQEVGVLIHQRVQTAAIGDAVPPTCAVPQLMQQPKIGVGGRLIIAA